MAIVLLIWAFIAFLFGASVIAQAASAVHEIEAGIAFLIATVALGCAGIIQTLKSEHDKKAEVGQNKEFDPVTGFPVANTK